MSMKHIFPFDSHYLKWCHSKVEPINTDILLLSGDHNVGKTCLLFQAAVSHASEECHVTYICPSPLSSLPAPVHGMPSPEAKVLQNLKFLYMSSTDELVEYLSELHTSPVVSQVLILDDLDYYVNQIQEHGSSEHSIAMLFALIKDAVVYMKSKHTAGSPCVTYISTHHTSAHQLGIYKRFTKNIWTLNGSVDEDGAPIMQCKPFSSAEPMTIHYYITEDCFRLKNICVQK
ncbi:uncharacterized protein LOC106154661 isoform X2 [Lingula anatina]|uniref:Uncharacterized protein LOC106154661 isoform X2 n=1 Tax=Lingula anatina TaxID=7574 RepID=A0A1S3HGD7_LINAN|nr:uncharacterized protein LOC106154661 isoform X2 [Lingula anatina]|eukprot:XP_013384546.1 uncharacterized protein LOC106154661 isoform X2 [Lingula anatina]